MIPADPAVAPRGRRAVERADGDRVTGRARVGWGVAPAVAGALVAPARGLGVTSNRSENTVGIFPPDTTPPVWYPAPLMELAAKFARQATDAVRALRMARRPCSRHRGDPDRRFVGWNHGA
jgi:hypothetical protein